MSNRSDIDLIGSSLRLPNGRIVPNRLVKVAMDEGIGFGGGLPGKRHRRLYKRWAKGGWGMLISGNVHVDPRHPATAHDRSIPDASPQTIAAFALLRDTIMLSLPKGTEPPLLLMQISHGGIQSSSTINLTRAPWVRAMGPCVARPDTGDSVAGWVIGRAIFPIKSRRIVDFDEWLEIVDKFVTAARVASEAGWDGVQVHSAHGYLLASYLSPLTNPHAIPLPGVPWRIPLRLHLLWLVLTGIAQATPKDFIKAVKINCSDFAQGGLDEEQSSEIIKEIISWGLVDSLEISGGNYSNPAFATYESISSSLRQSLFAHFTQSLLPHLKPPPDGPAIILTGGLHSRDLATDALRTRTCDLVGIGRPACLDPELPRTTILNPDKTAEEANFGGYRIPGGDTMKWLLFGGKVQKGKIPQIGYLDGETEPLIPREEKPSGVPLIGAGISTFWHEWQLHRMGRGVDPNPNMNWLFGGFLLETIWWAILGGGPLGWWRSRNPA